MAKKSIKVLIEGGKATAGPPLGPALGPLGINVLAVATKINEMTKDYSGMKVPVEVVIDTDSKEFEVSVGTPTTAALIVRELSIEKGSSNPREEKVGNLTMEQVMKIAKIKRQFLSSKTLKSAMSEVVGTCLSMGVTIENQSAKEVQLAINEGKFDDLVKD